MFGFFSFQKQVEAQLKSVTLCLTGLTAGLLQVLFISRETSFL